MDRWVLSLLGETIRTVTERLDAYDVTTAGRAIGDFVDELSNWYVRRSRRRFWKGEDDADKKAAHSTLYECLVTVSEAHRPFHPVRRRGHLPEPRRERRTRYAPESVHLADWPEARGLHARRGPPLAHGGCAPGRSAREGGKERGGDKDPPAPAGGRRRPRTSATSASRRASRASRTSCSTSSTSRNSPSPSPETFSPTTSSPTSGW